MATPISTPSIRIAQERAVAEALAAGVGPATGFEPAVAGFAGLEAWVGAAWVGAAWVGAGGGGATGGGL